MIALIAAYAQNGVIGYQGRTPWQIRTERKRFLELTAGNAVIMNRNSYESLKKHLLSRRIIVLSSIPDFDGGRCLTASSLTEAIQLAGSRNVYIFGGARLYEEALPLVDKMYITEIGCRAEGDTYFPDFNKKEFIKVIEKKTKTKVPCRFVIYFRRQGKQEGQLIF